MYSIDIFCDPNTRSHIFTPKTVADQGVGAAELHIIDLADQLAKLGNKVRVYNSCPEEGFYGTGENKVEYLDTDRFIPQEERDVMILHRNPTSLLPYVNAKVKIHESCDQQTSGNYKTDIYPYVDAVTAISSYHKWYLVDRYRFDPQKIHVFDIGVRTNEYLQPIAKVPYRCIYTSTPSRGLKHLAKIFPAVRHFFNEAELYITSPSWGYGLETSVHPDTKLFEGMDGVYFLGKLPREQLVELQLSADLLLYPNTADGDFLELMCVAVAEAQVAGAVPITTAQGGIATTAMPPARFAKGVPTQQGMSEEYLGTFLDHVIDLFRDERKNLSKLQHELAFKARKRFDWNVIGKQWVRMIDELLISN